ncbi:hypothetical protein GJ496_007300 [Pomphorhynchus laevis]|nr:hypothetical protein GJ496_007300 [Pomphorhynchus laevis]
MHAFDSQIQRTKTMTMDQANNMKRVSLLNQSSYVGKQHAVSSTPISKSSMVDHQFYTPTDLRDNNPSEHLSAVINASHKSAESISNIENSPQVSSVDCSSKVSVNPQDLTTVYQAMLNKNTNNTINVKNAFENEFIDIMDDLMRKRIQRSQGLHEFEMNVDCSLTNQSGKDTTVKHYDRKLYERLREPIGINLRRRAPYVHGVPQQHQSLGNGGQDVASRNFAQGNDHAVATLPVDNKVISSTREHFKDASVTIDVGGKIYATRVECLFSDTVSVLTNVDKNVENVDSKASKAISEKSKHSGGIDAEESTTHQVTSVQIDEQVGTSNPNERTVTKDGFEANNHENDSFDQTLIAKNGDAADYDINDGKNCLLSNDLNTSKGYSHCSNNSCIGSSLHKKNLQSRKGRIVADKSRRFQILMNKLEKIKANATDLNVSKLESDEHIYKAGEDDENDENIDDYFVDPISLAYLANDFDCCEDPVDIVLDNYFNALSKLNSDAIKPMQEVNIVGLRLFDLDGGFPSILKDKQELQKRLKDLNSTLQPANKSLIDGTSLMNLNKDQIAFENDCVAGSGSIEQVNSALLATAMDNDDHSDDENYRDDVQAAPVNPTDQVAGNDQVDIIEIPEEYLQGDICLSKLLMPNCNDQAGEQVCRLQSNSLSVATIFTAKSLDSETKNSVTEKDNKSRKLKKMPLSSTNVSKLKKIDFIKQPKLKYKIGETQELRIPNRRIGIIANVESLPDLSNLNKESKYLSDIEDILSDVELDVNFKVEITVATIRLCCRSLVMSENKRILIDSYKQISYTGKFNVSDNGNVDCLSGIDEIERPENERPESERPESERPESEYSFVEYNEVVEAAFDTELFDPASDSDVSGSEGQADNQACGEQIGDNPAIQPGDSVDCNNRNDLDNEQWLSRRGKRLKARRMSQMHGAENGNKNSSVKKKERKKLRPKHVNMRVLKRRVEGWLDQLEHNGETRQVCFSNLISKLQVCLHSQREQDLITPSVVLTVLMVIACGRSNWQITTTTDDLKITFMRYTEFE